MPSSRLVVNTCLAVLMMFAGHSIASLARDAQADPVVQWNKLLLEKAEQEDGFLTLKGVRATSMLHIAAHDSLVAIHGHFGAYAYRSDASDANVLAAVTEAAHTVALHEYPNYREQFDRLRSDWLDTVPRGKAKDAGIALGRAAARAILAQRAGDGWDSEAEYRWHPMAPGVYAEFNQHSGTPEGFIFGTGWGEARGFALRSPDQFRSPAPPAITSTAYTEAFVQVKDLGRFQSMRRTPDQTHIALWWKDFAESSHNRLARDLITQQSLDLAEANRLLALVNMAVFDAYVASFENKFFYNHWRPYTAIRWADNDDNPDTVQEDSWTNTHNHTYAFPSYPSAHGTACASAMAAFIDVFGDDMPFTMHTPTIDIAGPFSGKINMQPPTRQFESFSDAAMECAMSRVYLGIHFRYDSVAGNELGREVGEYLITTQLRRQ